MQVPKRKPGKYSGGPADDHLTLAAIKKLREEQERIERARPQAVEELRRTREMGDLSENFAYSQAKARLSGMDMRVLEIKERLKRAVPITHGAAKDGSVRLGASVTVEAGGKERVYDIVGEQEADPSRGCLSYHSPLGAALLGKKAGDVAVVEANGKRIEYRITGVR